MESFDPFSEWLGRPPGNPPRDHYELLGLARFEPDLDLIAHAADTLRVRIRKIRPGSHPAEWQRLLDRLEAAKICLSDPIAKAAYDESIDTACHTVNVSGAPVVTWDSPSQEMGGDPIAEASQPHGFGTAQPISSASPFVEAPPVVEDLGQDGLPAEVATFPRIQPIGGKRKGTRLAVQLLVAAVVLLTIAVGLAALKQRRDSAETAANPPQQPGAASPTDDTDTEPGVAPPSNLPSEPPAAPEEPEPTSPAAPIATVPAAPEPSQPPPVAPAATVPSSAPRSAVDPARQQAFRRVVDSARAALASRNLEAAAAQLNEAVSLAQTDEDRAEVDQVELLRAHVDAFWGSLQAQINKLETGSEIQVGEMMVLVVETGPDYVILRVTGRNRRYSIREMPRVLAAAMAEQTFSKSPNAKALRASFLIAEPGGDADRTRQLLMEAAQGGAEVDELLAELNRSR